MKKEGTLLLLLLVFAAGTFACGKEAEKTKPAVEISTETETTVPDTEAVTLDTESTTEFYLPKEKTDELEEQYRILVKQIQEKVSDRDMKELSQFVSYPCYVGIENVMVVKSKEEFEALDPKQVFPDDLVKIIENTDADSLELLDAGYVISGENAKPNITIGMGEDGKVGITGFNY